MGSSEAILFWTAVGLYSVSSLLYIAIFAFRKEAWMALAFRLTLLAFLSHGGAIVARWILTGHPPVVGNYENALAGSWITVAVFIAICYRFGGLWGLGLPITPFALLMLGYGVMNNPQLEPLTSAYSSIWLAVHVVFAWFAYSSYVVATGIAILYLLKRHKLAFCADSKANLPFVSGINYSRLPDGDYLDDLGYRVITFGFITNAVMLAAGSIWASRLWGSYWSWDPVETWSLISWLTYAIYLHLRVAMGWREERMAWFSIAALGTVMFAFWGVTYVAGTLHSFESI